MNTGTKIRTILLIATSLNTALMATDLTGFHNPKVDTAYKVVSIILNFIIVAISHYYNNDYTEEACMHTGKMRLMKEQKKGIISGENFLDEGEEVEDEDSIEIVTDDDELVASIGENDVIVKEGYKVIGGDTDDDI